MRLVADVPKSDALEWHQYADVLVFHVELERERSVLEEPPQMLLVADALKRDVLLLLHQYFQ